MEADRWVDQTRRTEQHNGDITHELTISRIGNMLHEQAEDWFE